MDKHIKKRTGQWTKVMAAAAFWLVVWQLVVVWLDKRSGLPRGNILVASPLETVRTLCALVQTAAFWKTVGCSFARLASGFFLAVTVGILCAMAASVSRLLRTLLTPLLRLVKAVPVASFIILALFWLSSSKNLSVLISFLMVLPVIYTNVLQGIESTDKELLEMAEVFRIPYGKRIRYIYIPAVLPYFVSACSVGLGFCFKSGIAAEIIGLPDNSIGERLYEAKLYLLTDELFAWTAVIVLVSVIFERVVMLFVKALAKGLAGSLKGEEKETMPVSELGKAEEDATIPACGESSDLRSEELPEFSVPEGYGLYGVTKQFDGKSILKQFTLTIRPGETVALMGESGCGKSTAGKLLLGLLETDAGVVKRPKRMGAVFQEDRLCKEFDAVTNIAMVTGDRKAAENALAEVGLADVGKKPVAELSGGMKRRVAIVRALLSNGEVLVFDEPFTGLDVAGRQKILQYVKEKLQGRSALLITHSEAEALYLAKQIQQLTK